MPPQHIKHHTGSPASSLYLEPLLRWLHVGGRGYKMGTIHYTAEKLQHACSSFAYADDLEILTQNLSDMRVQADKLTTYADWGQMKVNTGKQSSQAYCMRPPKRSAMAFTLPHIPECWPYNWRTKS